MNDKYGAQLREMSAELQDCFQACKQPARTETKPNLCLLLLREHKGASEEVYSHLSAMGAALLGIAKPLGVHLLGDKLEQSIMCFLLHYIYNQACLLLMKSGCSATDFDGGYFKLGVSSGAIFKSFIQTFLKTTLDSFFSCLLSIGALCLLQNI